MDENTHPLNEAIVHRDIEGMLLLLLFGANSNAPDHQGKTPLFLVVEESFIEGLRLLLKYRADPCFMTSEMESALGLSVQILKTEYARLILSHGADANHKMRNGNTVLIEAIQKRAPRRLINLLLNAGADPDSKNKKGMSALFAAVQGNQVTIVTALLNNGANPNLPGLEHVVWPAIYRPACLHILIASGADVRKAPGIIEQAIIYNNINSTRSILRASVNPNFKKEGVVVRARGIHRDIWYQPGLPDIKEESEQHDYRT
ncbi:ankyrin repeat-containing domain protein [Aspergillus arachidicola]|uniref:Ankyrin repeat-containing domain protein n=1 Tax=Aspergillus arachidicola TaxID=656916 RepID=A0A5N6YHZ5_9EURO|nr:ankyrin repeat-containing domain protein [Aspergillus arachidicola]